MSRDGFAHADLDVGLHSDPKVVALARRLRDPLATGAYTSLYVALVLQSWSAGSRLTLEEAAPAWWLEPLNDAREHLAAVGLIDAESRIPEHAWSSWYEPADRRRQGGRDRWQRWNDRQKASAEGQTVSTPVANASPTPTDSPSVSQTEQTVRTLYAPAPIATKGRSRLRGFSEPRAIKEMNDALEGVRS